MPFDLFCSTKLELVISLKTAKTLDLDAPLSLLAARR
jgi:hypothetical protein